MAVKTRIWDPSEHLDNEEAVFAYINAALEDGDPALIAAAIGDVAKARGMAKVARDAGLSRESLYKALRAEGNPEFGTILKVLRALNIHLSAEPQQGAGNGS